MCTEYNKSHKSYTMNNLLCRFDGKICINMQISKSIRSSASRPTRQLLPTPANNVSLLLIIHWISLHSYVFCSFSVQLSCRFCHSFTFSNSFSLLFSISICFPFSPYLCLCVCVCVPVSVPVPVYLSSFLSFFFLAILAFVWILNHMWLVLPFNNRETVFATRS